MKSLGRRAPPNWVHVEKYPLTAKTAPASPVPVALGINWYTSFDIPAQHSDGTWWIGDDPKNLGTVRGGHCICLQPSGAHTDAASWRKFYNQGNEGACVGFGTSRMMSLLNRKRYFARWLWDKAKTVDEWPDSNPGDDNGTSVRAACAILKLLGHVPWKDSYKPLDGPSGVDGELSRDAVPAMVGEGIDAYRWAVTAEMVMETLGVSGHGHVVLLNSWGTDYPRRVMMPAETLQRLISEDGEACVVTDR